MLMTIKIDIASEAKRIRRSLLNSLRLSSARALIHTRHMVACLSKSFTGAKFSLTSIRSLTKN